MHLKLPLHRFYQVRIQTRDAMVCIELDDRAIRTETCTSIKAISSRFVAGVMPSGKYPVKDRL